MPLYIQPSLPAEWHCTTRPKINFKTRGSPSHMLNLISQQPIQMANPRFRLWNDRWRPKKPLTTLSIISAQRASGRNSVSCVFLEMLRCALRCLKPHLGGGKIGDAVAVDPAISSGLPLPTMNRQPPPGSRPEKYSTPATKGILNHFHFHPPRS